jgi:hypothetical protein
LPNLDVNNLPDLLTTDDLASLLRLDVDQVRQVIRKHKDILRPFKLGRENRIERESFETFYSLLKQNKL